MKSVFVDTVYWIAVVRPRDPWKTAAVRARAALGNVHLVTTDEVLTEFLTALGTRPHLRKQAARMVHAVHNDATITVVEQSRATFVSALQLYEDRPDKEYSLTDCASMAIMRERGLTEVLTNDHHFTQEGFTILIGKKDE